MFGYWNLVIGYFMKIIIITGQTATGKTKLALEYAKKYDGELINCDSRQIYKYLDIITGKDLEPNTSFQLVKKTDDFEIGFYPFYETKIWLYDVITPDKRFSSFDWKNLALEVIKDILKRKKTPIIVGGTYLYLYHLLYKIHTENIKPNPILRKKLEKLPLEELQKKLQKLNPSLWEKLSESDKKNPQRLIRKIEISLQAKNLELPQKIQTDKIALFEKLGKEYKDIQIKFIGLRFKNKETLKKKIRSRVEERIKKGAIEEVKNLLKMDYKESSPGLNTIGYKQLIKYLKGEYTLNQAVEEWIKKEIQYAKRQYTFMKKDKNIKWKEVKSQILAQKKSH